MITRRWRALMVILLACTQLSAQASAKGGTNVHEAIPVSHDGAPTVEPSAPNESFGGCGRGRYRDARTHKCRGPADFGN
jgi:hypothetical protein